MVFDDVTLTGMTPPSALGFHSVMWDIPGTVSMLPMGLGTGSPPAGSTGLDTLKQTSGLNRRQAWLGPCPNAGGTTRTKTDTYNFILYALSQQSLGVAAGTTMTVQQLQTLIEGMHPLGKAILAGKSNAAATSLK